jgi:hypothetical protein
MQISKELKQRLKTAIEKHEQAYGSMCWGNGKSGIRELPNDLDGDLLEEIIKILCKSPTA